MKGISLFIICSCFSAKILCQCNCLQRFDKSVFTAGNKSEIDTISLAALYLSFGKVSQRNELLKLQSWKKIKYSQYTTAISFVTSDGNEKYYLPIKSPSVELFEKLKNELNTEKKICIYGRVFKRLNQSINKPFFVIDRICFSE